MRVHVCAVFLENRIEGSSTVRKLGVNLNGAKPVRLSVLLFYRYSERRTQLWHVLLKPWWYYFTPNNLTSGECVAASLCPVDSSGLVRRVDIHLSGQQGRKIHTTNNEDRILGQSRKWNP